MVINSSDSQPSSKLFALGKKMHAADLGAELPSAEVSWQWKGCLSDQYWVLRQRYCVVG